MKTTYIGGIQQCLLHFSSHQINAHTFLFFLGEHIIAIRPENALCRFYFDVSMIYQLEHQLSHLTFEVSQMFMEVKGKHGLAQIELSLYAQTDENDSLVRRIQYREIPFQLIQHRAIVLSKKPKILEIHPTGINYPHPLSAEVELKKF